MKICQNAVFNIKWKKTHFPKKEFYAITGFDAKRILQQNLVKIWQKCISQTEMVKTWQNAVLKLQWSKAHFLRKSCIPLENLVQNNK